MTAGDTLSVISVRIQRHKKNTREDWESVQMGDEVKWFGISPYELEAAFKQMESLKKRYGKTWSYRVVKHNLTDAGTWDDVVKSPREILRLSAREIERVDEI
jgi:hypothetical protein